MAPSHLVVCHRWAMRALSPIIDPRKVWTRTSGMFPHTVFGCCLAKGRWRPSWEESSQRPVWGPWSSDRKMYSEGILSDHALYISL